MVRSLPAVIGMALMAAAVSRGMAQGKFSAEYVIAAGLLDGQVTLKSFVDSAVQRATIQELIRKIDVRESATPPMGPPEWEFAYSVLEVKAGGEVLRERVDIPRGDCRNPLTDDELDHKFMNAVEFAGGGLNGNALLAEVKAIPSRTKLDGFAHIKA